MDSEDKQHRGNRSCQHPEPRVFKPLLPEVVEEFFKDRSHAEEPEDTPPRDLRRRLAWIRERREKKFRGTRTRQQ
jgi:hypothetical protein